MFVSEVFFTSFMAVSRVLSDLCLPLLSLVSIPSLFFNLLLDLQVSVDVAWVVVRVERVSNGNVKVFKYNVSARQFYSVSILNNRGSDG